MTGTQRHTRGVVLTILSWRFMCCVLVFICWQGGFTQINCNTDIFIGGVPSYDEVKDKSGIRQPFSGSIQKVQAPRPHACCVTLTADGGTKNRGQRATHGTQRDFDQVLPFLRFHFLMLTA